MRRRHVLVAAAAMALVAGAIPVAIAATQSSTTQVAGARYVDPVFDRITVTRDIQYGQATNVDGTPQALLLDLFEPAGDDAQARPVFIFAHGSLYGGDKSDPYAVKFATEMVRRGYVAASINFRLLPPGPARGLGLSFVGAVTPDLVQGLENAQHDMQASVRWFRAHAASTRIDPGRIIVAGHSTGAALALYTNYKASDPGDSGNPGYPSDVAAAVSYSGTMLEPSGVHPGAPPVLMVNALDDQTGPYPVDMSVSCAPALAVSDVCAFSTYSQGGHGLNGHSSENIAAAADFLCQYVVVCEP